MIKRIAESDPNITDEIPIFAWKAKELASFVSPLALIQEPHISVDSKRRMVNIPTDKDIVFIQNPPFLFNNVVYYSINKLISLSFIANVHACVKLKILRAYINDLKCWYYF